MKKKSRSFLRFLCGAVGIIMLVALTLGFFITIGLIAAITNSLGINSLLGIIIYVLIAIFLIWYGFG